MKKQFAINAGVITAWTLLFVAVIGESAFAADCSGPVSIICGLSTTLFGWIKAIGLVIVLPAAAFGLVKAIWGMVQGNATGMDAGRKIFIGALSITLMLVLLEPIVNLVTNIGTSTGNTIQNCKTGTDGKTGC